jgi:hypothetical protein
MVRVAAACALAATAVAAPAARAAGPRAKFAPKNEPVMKRTRAAAARAGHGGAGAGPSVSPPLVNHGGPVQTDPVVYLDLWGTGAAGDATLRQAALQLILDLPGSGWNQILTQYGVRNDVRIGGVWLDRQSPPQGIVSALAPITDAAVAAEANRAVVVNGWPRSVNTQVVVMPQAGSAIQDPDASGAFCAFHNYDFSGGFAYSLLPSVADPFFQLNCLGSSTPAGSIQRSLGHEYAETATDPQINAYYTDTVPQLEIADLCNGLPATVGADTVQELWDNSLFSSAAGCASSGPNGPVDRSVAKPLAAVAGSHLRANGGATTSTAYTTASVQVTVTSGAIHLPGSRRYRLRSCLELGTAGAATSLSCADKEAGTRGSKPGLVARTPAERVTLRRPLPAGTTGTGWVDVYTPRAGKWHLAMQSARAAVSLQ